MFLNVIRGSPSAYRTRGTRETQLRLVKLLTAKPLFDAVLLMDMTAVTRQKPDNLALLPFLGADVAGVIGLVRLDSPTTQFADRKFATLGAR